MAGGLAVQLIDLHPEFLSAGGEGISDRDGNPVPERPGVGVLFDCPCGNHDESHQLFVPFKNPIGDGVPYDGERGWQRTGETFETLTLTPSILRIGGCGWHGFITNGEIVTV
jgi:hypothetical protein